MSEPRSQPVLRLGRQNLLERTAEPWQPPRFTLPLTAKDQALARARRFLDLQAGSIWNDLATLLPQCRGTILDVGCGAQPYRPLIHPSAHYQGIDYALAGTNFGYSAADTTYYEGDLLPVADASVDVVLCTETLEHVIEPPVLLSEVARCLKPGGALLLTVPFAARWHFIPHDCWRFTPTTLERLLAAAGFERMAVYARGNALTVACYKVMALFLPGLFAPQQGLLRRLTLPIRLLLTAPILVILAALAWISMTFGRDGNDCLGYTAVAFKRSGTEGPTA